MPHSINRITPAISIIQIFLYHWVLSNWYYTCLSRSLKSCLRLCVFVCCLMCCCLQMTVITQLCKKKKIFGKNMSIWDSECWATAPAVSPSVVANSQLYQVFNLPSLCFINYLNCDFLLSFFFLCYYVTLSRHLCCSPAQCSNDLISGYRGWWQ